MDGALAPESPTYRALTIGTALPWIRFYTPVRSV